MEYTVSNSFHLARSKTKIEKRKCLVILMKRSDIFSDLMVDSLLNIGKKR